MRLFEGTPFDIPPKCDHCGLGEDQCKCSPAMKALVAPEKQIAKLSIEKRKKGKTVTVVTGLSATANDLHQLLKQLKSSCGAGGTVNGDTIEIQGEHISRVQQELGKIGYRVK